MTAVSFSANFFSTSCFVSFTAVSAGSSGEMSLVMIYVSAGRSIFIPTSGMFTLTNFILSGSVSAAEACDDSSAGLDDFSSGFEASASEVSAED